jgi:hypothetical protein
MATRSLHTYELLVCLLAGISVGSSAYGASVLPDLSSNQGNSGSLFVPVWWYGPNGGICIHTASGAVQCRPSYGREPNPSYYRPGNVWVPGHWFRGRWIAGHWG